ncbi:hypothetical protein Lalb_Chr12g0198971 [Lupinus albus]|uniref:Uncharacterized protein n=1 Tax=Lupinus albus TaxID=3870 RepID=A0A6A4PLP4_LUPAL|nr:hypothetical protein Lalb_Chr12g0198971 [Lupinus albus]
MSLHNIYKSFQTRRKFADCAILVEQIWYLLIISRTFFIIYKIHVFLTCFCMIFVFIHRWKLLDFTELKHSSISSFDIEKHETVISHISQAVTKAAKVRKCLSKDDKAQNLALHYWLEALWIIYIYYDKWLQRQSRKHFFCW